MSLQVGFTSKDFAATMDLAWPRAGLWVLPLCVYFLLLGLCFLFELDRRVSHSCGTRWLKIASVEEELTVGFKCALTIMFGGHVR